MRTTGKPGSAKSSLVLLVVTLTGCSCSVPFAVGSKAEDAGLADAAAPSEDSGADSGTDGPDAGSPDSGSPDGGPTCSDGVANGQEDAIDCGGPDCPACPEVSFGSDRAIIATEADGTLSVKVTLSTPSPLATRVAVELSGTTDGADFALELAGGVLEIPAGATTASIPVKLVQDLRVEPIEYLNLTLTSVPSGNARLGALVRRRILIKDDDPEQQLQVVSGSKHNCVKFADGTVKCWGGNDHGQLGLGDTQNRGDAPGELGANLPTVNLGTGVKVAKLSSSGGAENTCALLVSGDVKCWGFGSTWNEPGYLGYGHSQDLGDQASDMGDALPTIALGTGVKAKDLSSGAFNTCVITADDQAKCWGVGFHGANGNASDARIGASLSTMGDALPYLDLGTGVRVLKVAMAAFHRCAILEDLTLKCWGWNLTGQLGYEDTNTRGDDPGEMGEALPAVDLGPSAEVVDIVVATGNYVESGSVHHSCALLSTGEVKCWGANGQGELGLGDTTPRGGQPGTMGNALPAVDLGSGRTAKRLFASNQSTCALLDDDSLKCWGKGQAGQLGSGGTANVGTSPASLGDGLAAVFLGTGRHALHVSGGFLEWSAGHRCAVLDSLEVKCWGACHAGELGTGDLQTVGDAPGEMEMLAPIPLQ